jgi:hypothetical protein
MSLAHGNIYIVKRKYLYSKTEIFGIVKRKYLYSKTEILFSKMESLFAVSEELENSPTHFRHK